MRSKNEKVLVQDQCFLMTRRKTANRASRATILIIIAAAEKLFSMRGIDNVSMREIAFASGLKNTSAVNYHFGGKEELVQAISHHYTLEFENVRARMMDTARTTGRIYDLQTLLEILVLPYLSIVGPGRSHRYAKFLSQVTLRSADARTFYPFLDDADKPAPICKSLLQHLRDRMPHLPEEIFRLRVRGVIRIFVGAVVGWDNADVDNGSIPSLENTLIDALSQMTAAISAPFHYEDGRSLFMLAGDEGGFHGPHDLVGGRERQSDFEV
ncbi:hypothetical protein DM806_26595 [Sphingobium lactosutens]|uniref:helix-turn-helix domain-containing protein n=1 Tax=Sphingobium lactosutens TaxID=522773 RepID=UPI0015BCB486|nr:helix-turn-helix domain-containing protein [Sphingobium lactosutens]NWK99163.1 hypothetical protein [Sphingobium lactosutens]